MTELNPGVSSTASTWLHRTVHSGKGPSAAVGQTDSNPGSAVRFLRKSGQRYVASQNLRIIWPVAFFFKDRCDDDTVLDPR